MPAISSGASDANSPSCYHTSKSSPDGESQLSQLSASVSECAGCGQTILDRYYLLAVDRKWHGNCLKCSVCLISLDAERSCFSRDGQIFCKEDYYK